MTAPGQNTDGQNTDGENAWEHESGKNGQIQYFGPANNFSIGILSIFVLSWSRARRLDSQAYVNCQSHLVGKLCKEGRLWKKSGPFQGWPPLWVVVVDEADSNFLHGSTLFYLALVAALSLSYTLLVVRRPWKRTAIRTFTIVGRSWFLSSSSGSTDPDHPTESQTRHWKRLVWKKSFSLPTCSKTFQLH